jgi:DNA-binding transcriptional LysR family regulator
MFQQMTTFVRIADTGSISRAARSLKLSVAMASRHLRWLEEELGAPLMRRTTRRIDLTDAGHEFLARARAVLRSLDEAREVVRPGAGAVGRVVVSVPVAFGLGRVSPLVPGLLAAHPRLTLDLRFEDRAVDLLADGVDLALRAGTLPPDSASLIARMLGSYERVLCASPKLLAKVGPIASLAALAKAPGIAHGTGAPEWTFTTRAGTETVPIAGRLSTNSLHATRDAIVAGVGIAWLPLWLAEADLRARRLVRVLPAAKLAMVPIVGLFHKQGRGGGAVRAVLDHLEAALRPTLEPPRSAGR